MRLNGMILGSLVVTLLMLMTPTATAAVAQGAGAGTYVRNHGECTGPAAFDVTTGVLGPGLVSFLAHSSCTTTFGYSWPLHRCVFGPLSVSCSDAQGTLAIAGTSLTVTWVSPLTGAHHAVTGTFAGVVL